MIDYRLNIIKDINIYIINKEVSKIELDLSFNRLNYLRYRRHLQQSGT